MSVRAVGHAATIAEVPQHRLSAASKDAAYREVLGRQAPFTVVITVVAAAFFGLEAAVLYDEGVIGGLTVALVATALAVSVPWGRVPACWSALVPLLDIASVALLEVGGIHAAVLLVLPTLWMSTVHGSVGVGLAVVGGTLAAWAGVLSGTSGTDHLERLLLLPLILGATGMYLYASERRSTARQALLARQSGLVNEVLEESRQQSRLLGSILNTIDVGVIALDSAGRLTIVNRAHALLLRGALKVGDHVSAAIRLKGYREDGVAPLTAATSPLVRASRGEIFEGVLTWWDFGGDGDGGRRALRVSASQLTDSDGERFGAVVVYQDVTAEMVALAEREALVASVSHELRTPLTSILGYLDLAAEEQELPRSTRAQLEVVERNARRLLRLIADLLTAAQTAQGRLDVAPTVTDLSRLVAEVVEDNAPLADDARVKVAYRPTGPCEVWADAARLAQVVDNLLSNAVKYSRPGGNVELVLEEGDERVRLRVRDNGIGMSEVDQAQLFSRFHRAGAVRRGSVEGTGLGLHIAREIAEAHGGTIEVDSELGRGTEMVLSVPVGARRDA